MPTIDRKFVDRLENFTTALDKIVQLLNEDLKKENADSVNEMLSAMNNDLGSVVKNLQIVVKSVGKIENTTDKILEEIRASKKDKEKGGVFQSISETENKKKIIDAVKVITLIAAGILAIGLAIKLIAPVDFLSVIGIGLTMVFIAGAFVMVASLTEGMTWKDAAIVSSIMVVMSTGLMVSSWALGLAATISFAKMMSIIFTATAMGISLPLVYYAVKKSNLDKKDYPKMMLLPLVLPLIALGIAISSLILAAVVPLTFAQVITTIFVATAIGTSLWLITKALDKAKLENRHVNQFLMVPIIVPALAQGLVISSWILSGIKPISFMQMISSVFVAVTIGVLVYLMSPLINKMKDFTLKEVVSAGLLVTALSVGLVAASWILVGIKFFSFRQSLQLIMTSLAIGLSVLFLTPAIYALKPIKSEEMLRASTNILIASGTIMASSWLLNLGIYDNFPDWKWSIGSGLVILAFAGLVWTIKKLNLSTKELFVGGLSLIGISAVIMITSWILNKGKYDEYPSVGWSLGVGLSLIAFGTAMMIIGGIISMTGGSAAIAMTIGSAATIAVAGTIWLTSIILNEGKYDEYPSVGWSLGVGLSLIAFGSAMGVLGLIIMATGGLTAGAMLIGAIATLAVAGTIMLTSLILNKGDYYEYPTIEWSLGVGLSLIAFGTSMGVIGSLTLASGGLVADAMLVGVVATLAVAGTIMLTSLIIGLGNYEDYPSLEWAAGVGLSIVAFSGTMAILGSFGLLSLVAGGLATLGVSGIIVLVSNILSQGNYEKGPTVEWSLGTGALLLAVGMSTILFTSLLPFVIIGGFVMKYVAQSIVDVADILAMGDYTGGPTEEWAKGVGGSIMAFAKGLSALSESDSFLGSIFGQSQSDKIIEIANAMTVANDILSSVGWSGNYPNEEWSKGVGGAIMMFAKGLAALEEADVDYDDFIEAVEYICHGIITAANILNGFDWSKITNYPTSEWSKGVGEAINAFASPLAELGKNDITGRDITRSIRRLAYGMIDAAEIIGEYDWNEAVNNYPTSEWSDAVGKAIGTFVKYLVEIEKEDVGKGDIKILKKTIASMINAAEAFNDNPDIWNTYPTGDWAEGVGKSVGTFVKYLAEIEKKDIGRGDVKTLRKTISAMIDAAEDFSDDPTIWSIYPTGDWAEGVGKSIGTFLKYLVEIEKKDIGKGDIKNLNSIISAMINTAEKFEDSGDIWSNYPPDTWVTNVNLAINSFIDMLNNINQTEIGTDNLIGLYLIIKSLLWTAKQFSNKDNVNIWTNYPPDTWVTNVNLAINSFIDMVYRSSMSVGNLIGLYLTINALLWTARQFSDNEKTIWTNYPPTEWSDAVLKSIQSFTSSISMLSSIGYNNFSLLKDAGNSMIDFSKIIKGLDNYKDLFKDGGSLDNFSKSIKKLVDNLPTKESAEGLKTLADAMNSITSMGISGSFSIWMLSKAINDFGESLSRLDTTALTNLSKFSNGVLILSLIDDKKLEETLRVLDEKKNEIKSILSDNATAKTKETASIENKVETPDISSIVEDTKNKFYEDILTYVKSLDDNVKIMATPKPFENEENEEIEQTSKGNKVN